MALEGTAIPETAETPPPPRATTYVAVNGISWTDQNGREYRAEVGETVPADVVVASPWLLEQGHVQEAG